MSNVERKYHVQLTSKITEHWLCERNNLDSSIENDGISICHQSYGKRHEVSAPTLHSTANERIKVPESSKTDSPHKGILIPTYYYPICCQSTSNSLKSRNITCEASYIDKPLELTKIQCRNNSNIVGHLHTERSKYETLEDPGVFVSDRLQETVNISNVPHKSCIDDFTKRVNVSSNVEVFPYSYYDDSDDDSNFLKELKKESSIREGSNSQLIKKEFRSELGATGNCRDFLKLMDHTETVKDCNKCKESEALLIHRATVKNECEHKQPLLGYIQANGNSKNNEATRTANNKLDLSCKFSRNEKRTMRDSYNTTSPWHQYSSQLSTKLNEKNLTNSISSHGPLMPSSVTAEKKFWVPNVSEWYQQTVMLPRNAEDDTQADATMETRVAGQGQPKRVGRWTLAQLRQTDGIIPSQAGWNKGDSQKLMTNFGTPRNTQTRVTAENLPEVPEELLLRTHGEVRLQSGTNKFESQRGMTGFGTGRDVCREGVHVNQAPSDLAPLEEEKIRLSDGIVRLQAGTNKYDSQKGMTGFGTARRETTKMKDTKHPEYDHERPDQSEIPLQAGTNKFASQKGMTGFGTSRRETTKICDSAHPDYDPESSIDATTIPSQMGSNKYASQKGMTGFGQPRWEVLDPSISWQNRKSQGMVRLQSGTNRFASQQGMTGFGTPRNTTYEAEAGELPYEEMKKSETVIPSQAGWNRGDSQKGMTGFGAPRDVKGKHLKRIWELEYPEEAEASLDRL